jgi:outer membrane usher protein FimD/PapC
MKRLLWLMSVILAFALLITLPTTFTYAAAQFKVSDLSISPTFLIAGSGDSNITVSVKVANIGNESGTYKLELKINDAIETTKDIILDAGKDQTVIFPVTKKDVGEYNVAVENQKGVFNIAPASLDIKTLLIDPPEATPGTDIIISFTVQNKSSDQKTY